mmetsp:Transcript_35748/g.75074  ORF Transcript_35748/g.75074 Transcript_35748/m.75074 type:complete len:94 (-) Transcript_35748:36-317(-)|eukprot:6190497-Pleurochrysis_carterae.AAC.3
MSNIATRLMLKGQPHTPGNARRETSQAAYTKQGRNGMHHSTPASICFSTDMSGSTRSRHLTHARALKAYARVRHICTRIFSSSTRRTFTMRWR